MDAFRIRDNIKVTLKLVPTGTEQIPIALYLSSDPLLSDRRNRTVRILDVVPLPDDDEWGLLVMPFLREFDDPPFQSRVECVEALRQMLEVFLVLISLGFEFDCFPKGLEFMHEHNVAHRYGPLGRIALMFR
jgi:hypothetical protein